MEEGVTLGPLPVSGPHRSPTSNHFGKKEGDEGRKEGGEKRRLRVFPPRQAQELGSEVKRGLTRRPQLLSPGPRFIFIDFEPRRLWPFVPRLSSQHTTPAVRILGQCQSLLLVR